MNRKHPSILISALLLVMLLMLSACSGQSQKPSFPTGRFIKSGETNYGLKFNTDNTFSVFQGDNTFVHGTYSVDGNVFTETSNDGGCKSKVSFNYDFNGKTLTFKYVGNPADDAGCTGRYADFNNVSYSLSNLPSWRIG